MPCPFSTAVLPWKSQSPGSLLAPATGPPTNVALKLGEPRLVGATPSGVPQVSGGADALTAVASKQPEDTRECRGSAAPTKLYLWALRFEFHGISVCPKAFFFQFLSLNHLKM